MKIIKAKDLLQKASLNMIIYGAPGIGKTTFAASAPKPLIIDMEGGSLSIMDTDADLAQVKTLADIQEAVKYAIDNKYETIVFDSLTRYSEILLDAILAADKKLKPQIQHWGDLVTRVKKSIWGLQGQEMNTIFLCLEKEIEEDNQLIKRPSLNGQLQQSIPAIMDVVGYLYADQGGNRHLSVNPTGKWYAKHRAPVANRIQGDIEPTFEVLKDRLFGLSKGE